MATGEVYLVSERRRVKASDVDELKLLEILNRAEVRHHGGLKPWRAWTMVWDIMPEFPIFPWRVVNAKLTRLMDKGYVTGCNCGCRGDWEITEKGEERLRMLRNG